MIQSPKFNIYSGMTYSLNNELQYGIRVRGADKISEGLINTVVFDSTTSGKLESLSSFIAFKLTDRSGDGDIKIDHIDKIRYLDSLTIKVKLPKKYS